MSRRVIQISLLALLGFVIGTTSAWLEVNKDVTTDYSRIEPAAGTSVSGSAVGGAFTLTDHFGNPVTEQNYADSYKLVFFGFTSCPDICPTELKKITTVLEALGPKAESIQPLFISIDPARDTPDALKQYVEMFHPRLIGLTGTPEQVKAAQKAFKVYAAKVDDPALTEYTMNHSSFTFLMNQNNELVSLFTTGDNASDMVKEILQTL